MPEAIVSRLLRLPGYGVYAWEADEATGTLRLAIRQAANRSATPTTAQARDWVQRVERALHFDENLLRRLRRAL